MEEYTCTRKEYHHNHGCDVCVDDTKAYAPRFFFDYGNQIEIGDVVQLWRNDKGFYNRMAVNGIEVTIEKN